MKKGQKRGQKWPKMTYFWVIFDHLFNHLICVCLILFYNCVHIWVKHEKMVQKGVQKVAQNRSFYRLWVKFWDTPFCQFRGVQKWVILGPLFWPFLTHFRVFAHLMSRSPTFDANYFTVISWLPWEKTCSVFFHFFSVF